MKIGITGHTSGVGKAFSKLCDHKGITWFGFSRDNGYDIATEKDQVSVIEALVEFNCDVFINNAFDWEGHGIAQTEMLYKIWAEWKHKKSTVVCVSSAGPEWQKNKDEIPPWDKGKGILGYDTYKHALDYACAQLNKLPYWDLGYNCRIINIKPGLIETPLVSDENLKEINATDWIDAYKMDPNYIASIIKWTMDQPELISSITIMDDQRNKL